MMKKTGIKVIAIVLVLLSFFLMAVGSGSTTESSETGGTAEVSSTYSESGSSDVSKGKSESTAVVEEIIASEPTYTISDEILVNDENCVFKIIEAKDDSLWGFTLKVYCENKTSDKTLMFSLSYASVNGYMCDPYWATEVAAGKKANSEINFDLDAVGVESPDEISFTLLVSDSDDWAADYFVHDKFTIYPTGLSADQIVIPERTTTSTEQVIIDNETCTFVILDVDEDGMWGYTLDCYMENKTDKTGMFSWNDVSVNGFMVDPYWANEVAAGKRAYAEISFYTSDFEDNGIETVEEIEFTLTMSDADDWFSDYFVDSTFIYVP